METLSSLEIQNRPRREREYLTPREVDELLNTARNCGRHGERDATLILLTPRHGLYLGELLTLKWSQVDFKDGYLYVIRQKTGLLWAHPLWSSEIEALERLKQKSSDTDYIFVSDRKNPLTALAVRNIIKRAAEKAGLGHMNVYPYMLTRVSLPVSICHKSELSTFNSAEFKAYWNA